MQNNMRLIVISTLLAQGRYIALFSFMLTTVATIACFVFAWFSMPLPLLVSGLIVTLGIIESYFAIRVDIDSKLFSHLAERVTEQNSPLSSLLPALDQQLAELGLVVANTAPRDLISRQQGAMGLLKKQLGCLIAQIVIWLVMLVWLLI